LGTKGRRREIRTRRPQTQGQTTPRWGHDPPKGNSNLRTLSASSRIRVIEAYVYFFMIHVSIVSIKSMNQVPVCEVFTSPGLQFVALVDAVDELRIGRLPPDADRRRVDGLGAHLGRRRFRNCRRSIDSFVQRTNRQREREPLEPKENEATGSYPPNPI